MTDTIKYLDLFTGVGGFTYGIQKATPNLRPIQSDISQKSGHLHHTEDELQQWECVGYSEIDKYATSVYKYHYPNHHNYGDITTINASDLPDFDLLVGGFPCQSFSIAGKRGGFDDTRGTMFFEIARICAEKRPRYVLLENVKGLLSHDSGKTFQTILGVLADLGYRVEWQVLNSKDFGVPQNRERVFIIGHLGGIPERKVFPIGESSGKNLKEHTRGASQGNRVYDTDGVSVTLASQAGGLGAKTGLYMSHINRSKGEYDVKATERAGALTATMYKGIDASGRTGAIQDSRIRRLTPLECERLQGFPDNWTAKGVNEKGEVVDISDSQRYKMCGNAVTTNVITEIIKRLWQTQ